jgi:hypothetical protein
MFAMLLVIDGIWPFNQRKKEKKEISYIEGKMKDIGARVGYTVL